MPPKSLRGLPETLAAVIERNVRRQNASWIWFFPGPLYRQSLVAWANVARRMITARATFERMSAAAPNGAFDHNLIARS